MQKIADVLADFAGALEDRETREDIKTLKQ
jgi:hypothetical protein